MPKMIITKMIGSAQRLQAPLNMSAARISGIGAEVVQTFTGLDGSPMPAGWTQTGGSVVPTIQGNALLLTSGPGAVSSTVQSPTVVTGDFDIMVDAAFTIQPATADWSADLIIIMDATHQMISRYQGATRYWTQGYINGGSWVWNTLAAPSVTSVKLRVARIGSMWECYILNQSGGGWYPIGTPQTIGTGSVVVQLRACTWTNFPVVAWKADNLTIRFGQPTGICEGMYHEMRTGIEESEAENKPESFSIPYNGRLFKGDHKAETVPLQTPPAGVFPAPESTFWESQSQALGGGLSRPGGAFPNLRGGWQTYFGYSNLGYPAGDPAVLYTQNYDITETQSTGIQIYDPTKTGNAGRRPGGFNPNVNGGFGNLGGERVHYGYQLSSSTFPSVARMWGYPGIGANGGPPYWGFVHYGHDYVTNPSPPPATILNRNHEPVSIGFPPRWINHWYAASQTLMTNVEAPVSYAPKGAKCGVFMPMIIRFLITRRKNKLVTITAGAK